MWTLVRDFAAPLGGAPASRSLIEENGSFGSRRASRCFCSRERR
jgi:hypothetical protein